MRAARPFGLAAVAGIGLALLALSAFHMTTVGSCGSGSYRYGSQLAGPCPSNTGAWIGALAGSALVAIVATGLAVVLGPLFALALGGAMIVALATGAAHGSWVIAAVVLALVFAPIGAVGLWRVRRSIAPRLAPPAAALAVGAVAGAAIALAIPGPLREPKHVAFSEIEALASTSPQSYFQPAMFRSALQTVRAKLGPAARIASIDLRPGIAVISAVAGTTRHDFSLRYGGGEDDFTSSATSDTTAVAIGTIDVRAPQHLLAALRRQFTIAPSNIDEIDFVLGVIDGKPEWHAHMKDAEITRYYTSDAHGAAVKPPGG